MGIFKTEITLVNDRDKVRVECGVRKDVRAVTVDAMPDTGAWTLVINEEVQRRLGLDIERMVKSTLVADNIGEYGLTEPVEVRWKNRWAGCNAVVVPDGKSVLLGTLPLEGMDLMVDLVNQRLVGVNGGEPLYVLY